MVVLDFLRQGRRDVTVAHFNHGTEHGAEANKFVSEFTSENGIPATFSKVSGPKPKDQSWECYWRDERYAFLNSLDGPVITCHHLNDCMETWIFSSLHGQPKTIPYQTRNVIRPFLLTSRADIMEWAKRFKLSWVEDHSNQDVVHPRNRIRHAIMPHLLEINPGLARVVARQVRLANPSIKLSYETEVFSEFANAG